jgi:hypothetical protein
MPAEQAASQDETRREPMDGPPSPAVDFAAGSKDVGLSDYVKMPLEQRVVIKSSWKICFATIVPVGTILLTVQASQRSVGGAVFMVSWLAVAAVLVRALEYIELTPEGLLIHGFRGTTVPWHSVGAVDYVQGPGGMGHLNVRDLAAKRRRRLTAPRVVFGLGKDETDLTREVIQLWRLAYTGPVPLADEPSREPAEAPVPPAVDLDLA